MTKRITIVLERMPGLQLAFRPEAVCPAPLKTTVMRFSSLIAIAVVFGLASLLMVLLWAFSTASQPPTVRLVSLEPAGIIDDAGAEMWAVTLSLSNATRDFLYVQNSDWGFETKVANRWVATGKTLDCAMYAGQTTERIFLVPPHPDACRVTLKYTNAQMPFMTHVDKFAKHFPIWIQLRASPKIGMWLRHHQSRSPNLRWRKITRDLELPLAPTRGGSPSLEARNNLPQMTPIYPFLCFQSPLPGGLTKTVGRQYVIEGVS